MSMINNFLNIKNLVKNCRNRNRDGKANRNKKTGLKEIWSRHHSYSVKNYGKP